MLSLSIDHEKPLIVADSNSRQATSRFYLVVTLARMARFSVSQDLFFLGTRNDD